MSVCLDFRSKTVGIRQVRYPHITLFLHASVFSGGSSRREAPWEKQIALSVLGDQIWREWAGKTTCLNIEINTIFEQIHQTSTTDPQRCPEASQRSAWIGHNVFKCP